MIILIPILILIYIALNFGVIMSGYMIYMSLNKNSNIDKDPIKQTIALMIINFILYSYLDNYNLNHINKIIFTIQFILSVIGLTWMYVEKDKLFGK